MNCWRWFSSTRPWAAAGSREEMARAPMIRAHRATSLRSSALLALLLEDGLVDLEQEALDLRCVWLYVTRFPEVQRCGGIVALLQIELAQPDEDVRITRGQDCQA